ncbi:MAG: BMP family protein, partial [Acidimicrobiia bacterium]
RAVLRISPTNDTTVAIIIDQFEELFTITDPATTQRFLTALNNAADDPHRRVKVLLTVRADFYDRLLAHGSFGSAMSTGIVNVVPMAPEELEQAASQPAARAGARLDPDLEVALIGDVLGEPGALPLFQFALTDLFDRRVGETLTLGAYRDMGGIQGSLGRTAERLHERLTEGQQLAARQVFLRLVAVSDTETRSSRRVEAAELLSLGLEVTDLQPVLDTFGSNRLLSFDRNDVTGAPTVQVAHEALLQHWERLSNWIDEGTEDVRTNIRLAAAASEWTDNGRDSGYLLTAGRLDQYETWADTSSVSLARTERQYLDASTDLRDAKTQEEGERKAKEEATTRRARRNAFGLVGVLAIAAAIGSYLLWAAIQPEDPTVALVRTPDTDMGINAMILDGFEKAELDLDFVANDVVVLADMENTIRQLADDGTDLIIAGLDFEIFVGEIARDYPETTFAVVALPLPLEGDNISVAQYNFGDGDYLAGVAAALSSRTGIVGIVGGAHNEVLSQTVAAFEAGVKDTDDDVGVLIGWVSEIGDGAVGFQDADIAHDAATDLYESGADVLYSAALGASSGVMRAARDYTVQSGNQVWAIGNELDEGFLAEDDVADSILTSMEVRYDVAVYSIISAYLRGVLEKVMPFDMANGGLNYSEFRGNVEGIRDELDAAKSRLAREEVAIPTATSAPSIWRGQTDGILDVVYDGTSCTVSDGYVVAANDVVGFRFKNNTDGKAGFGIGHVPEGVTRESLDQDARATGSDFIELNLSYRLALWNNGGVPTSSWSVPGGDEAEIRSVFPDVDADFGAVSCFSANGVLFAELLPIGTSEN